MDNLSDYMFCGIEEEASSPSHPPTQFQPCSLDVNSQVPPLSTQGFRELDEIVENTMTFEWVDIDPLIPLETSGPLAIMYPSDSAMSLDRAAAHEFSSFHQGHVSYQTQNEMLFLDAPLNGPQPAESLSRKRAPKARTMSAKDWKPHQNRIRQLYVAEGKSINELRDIMNKELGITATARQYKVQIQQMKIEKNVKAKEREAIAKCIQHRARAIGKRSRVKVRGHNISQEKLSRWATENMTDIPFVSAAPPSPLPSCISVYTNSVCETGKQASLVMFEHQNLVGRFTPASNTTDALMQSLLRHAQSADFMIESQEAHEIFNDLQIILGSNVTAKKGREETQWNNDLEEGIVQIRNLMNLTDAIIKSEELKDTRQLLPINKIRDHGTDISKIGNSHAAWTTPYGRVQASFWSLSEDPHLKTRECAITAANEILAARLSIFPSGETSSHLRVVFDFTPRLNPYATVTYQATLPNDSEVFKIAASGEIKSLLGLIENRCASLTDQDEDGRSLLNHAFTKLNYDMCRFLIDKGADINAIEPDFGGYLRPVFSSFYYNDSEMGGIDRHKSDQLIRITLEAGADPSLELYKGDGKWMTVFAHAVHAYSFVKLKHVLDLGKPFINTNGVYKIYSNKECFTPLLYLAYDCGYDASETVDVVDKAILLLNRQADISCRDENGNTVLHTLLKCMRLHRTISRDRARRNGMMGAWILSFEAPKDLLMVFITAGADVYAANNEGQTPSVVALRYGREDEWLEALQLCGYDSVEVTACCIHSPTREHQTSKLSFEDYCLQRQQQQYPWRFEGVEIEYIDDESQDDNEEEEEEDGDDEYEVTQIEDSSNSQYVNGDSYEEGGHGAVGVSRDEQAYSGGAQDFEILGSVLSPDSGTSIGLHNEGKDDNYTAAEMVDDQVLELDNMVDKGKDGNLDECIKSDMDFMQDFIDFGSN